MRRSTQKIMIILAVTCCCAGLLDWLAPSGSWCSYGQALLLIGATLASAGWLGWAKPRRQTSSLVSIAVIIAALVFQIITFLLLGLKLGFARNLYGWHLANLWQIFLPITVIIIATETLRGQLVEKGRGSRTAVVCTGLALWSLMLLVALPAYQLNAAKAVFTFCTVVAGPTLLTNILLTYLAYYYDYRANIVYRLIMDLPLYLLPILPATGPFLPALFQIGFVFALILAVTMFHRSSAQQKLGHCPSRQTFVRPTTDPVRCRTRIIKNLGYSTLVITALFYLGLMSGLFRYSFLAVGSGSMEPTLYRGDLILVEKRHDCSQMQVGDTLVYHRDNHIIVHRIASITQVHGQYVFQTQGDHNASIDAWQVSEADVVGLVRGKIAKLGLPTLWLNELFNGES